MKYCTALAAAALPFVMSATAMAAPGLGTDVASPGVEKGEGAVMARWASLEGGPDDGAGVFLIEGGYGVTDRLRLVVITEAEKEPGESRDVTVTGFEALYELGSVGNFTFGLNGAYAVEFGAPDKIEGKFLVQNETGPWDFRLNLTAAKPLESGAPVELLYAASADVATTDALRLGVQAFGELGTSKDFLPRSEHFVGPAAKVAISGLGPEVELDFGYLFAIGAASDVTDGQLRVGIEFVF